MYWEQVKEYHQSHKEGYSYFGCTDTNEFRGLGFELELDNIMVENQDSFRENLAKILFSQSYCQHYIVEKDPSLFNGVELISQPHTIEVMREFLTANMTDLLSKLNQKEVELQNDMTRCRAAFHIHISKKVFGSTLEAQIQSISKFWYILSQNWIKMLKVFGREDYVKCNYPEPRLTKEKAIEKVTYELSPDVDKDTVRRYQAVNLRNYNTVEFRAAQASLDINRIIAEIELIWQLAIKSTTIEWHDCENWNKWVENSPECINYIINNS